MSNNALLTLPYALARLPWAVLDSALSTRLPEDAPPRLVLDKALGTSDQFVGRVLGNHDLESKGTARLERGEKLASAVVLEAEAAVRREQARDVEETAVEEAARKRKAAQQKAEAGLREADEVEAREKQAAAKAAADAAARKKAAADKRAATRAAAVHQREQQTEAQAEATRKAAQRVAKATLEDVSEKKSDAAEARADADRLEQLTEAKHDERTS